MNTPQNTDLMKDKFNNQFAKSFLSKEGVKTLNLGTSYLTAQANVSHDKNIQNVVRANRDKILQ